MAVSFCIYFFYQNREIVRQVWNLTSYRDISVSVLSGICGFFLFPVCIGQLYRGLNDRISDFDFRKAAKIHYVYYISNVFKYIPGKISTMLVLLDEGGRKGLNRAMLFQAWLGTNGLTLLISTVLALGVISPFIDNSGWNIFITAVAVLCISVTIIPGTNAYLIKIILFLFKRDNQNVRPFSFPSLINALILQIVGWISIGFSFAVISNAWIPMEMGRFWLTVLAYPAAYAAGFLAFFTPAGLGVREGLLTVFLLKMMDGSGSLSTDSTAIVLFIVVMHRVIMTVVDVFLLCFGFGLSYLLSFGENLSEK